MTGRADIGGHGMGGDAPWVVVFDSGLGGLTVARAIRALRPDLAMTYVADNACFPYGDLSETALVERVQAILETVAGQGDHDRPPDAVVIACNTASTLCLPPLRARFGGIEIVGTVPAIKPAAAQTRSGMISVLATPGTVRRDYTRALVDTFAGHVAVNLVGASGLAALAETYALAGAVDTDLVADEIAPCFKVSGAARTDTVVLACTHYPLLLPVLKQVAPWPVHWIDPAGAIARRLDSLVGRGDGHGAPVVRYLATRQCAGLAARIAAVMGLQGRVDLELAGL